MQITSPYSFLSPTSQKSALWVAFAVTLAVFAALRVLGETLITPLAPLGIISFEFVGSVNEAIRMVEQWGPTGRVYAGLSLGIDYLFLVAYPVVLGLACVLAAARHPAAKSAIRSLAAVLAWALIVTGLLDAMENYALIKLLSGSQSEIWPPIANACARIKFIIVGAGALFALVVAAIATMPSRSLLTHS